MRKIIGCLIVAVVAGCFAPAVFCQEKKDETIPVGPVSKETLPVEMQTVDLNKAIATVNDSKITAKDYQDVLKRVPPNYQSFMKNQKGRVVNDMISQELLYQEAKKQNLGEDKAVTDALENAKKQLMVQRYLQMQVSEKVEVTDPEVKNYYDAHKEEFNVGERMRVAHILVKTEKTAEDILARLKNKEDFAKLAQELSVDPSKANGGDIGYFEKGTVTPDFENAAFLLKPGEISGVVKTQFGYHIIKAIDKKGPEAKKFEDVKAEIKAKLAQEKQTAAFNKLLERLKNQSKISVDQAAVDQL